MNAIEARIESLVREFESGREWGSFSLGEALAVALVLDRIDLLRRDSWTVAEAYARLGPDWSAAVKAAKAARDRS